MENTNKPLTRRQRRAQERQGWFTPAIRRRIYEILVAAGPIVAFYGLATADEIALWLGLGATILGSPAAGMARANVTP